MLMGNLTRDIEVRYTPKGTAVTDIDLAVNRVWTDDNGEKKEDPCFVSVTCWGRQAEIAGQYLKKGRPVFIEGRLTLDTWEDKNGGGKRSRLKVVCENLQLLGSKPTNSDSDPRTSEEPPPTRSQRPQAAPAASRPAAPRDPDLDAEPDDIPF
jgi:single-strand DNA-binding protein